MGFAVAFWGILVFGWVGHSHRHIHGQIQREHMEGWVDRGAAEVVVVTSVVEEALGGVVVDGRAAAVGPEHVHQVVAQQQLSKDPSGLLTKPSEAVLLESNGGDPQLITEHGTTIAGGGDVAVGALEPAEEDFRYAEHEGRETERVEEEIDTLESSINGNSNIISEGLAPAPASTGLAPAPGPASTDSGRGKDKDGSSSGRPPDSSSATATSVPQVTTSHQGSAFGVGHTSSHVQGSQEGFWRVHTLGSREARLERLQELRQSMVNRQKGSARERVANAVARHSAMRDNVQQQRAHFQQIRARFQQHKHELMNRYKGSFHTSSYNSFLQESDDANTYTPSQSNETFGMKLFVGVLSVGRCKLILA